MNNSDEKEELYNNLSKTIKKQINKLDELDIYTSKHIHSVPKIAKKICKKLNLSDQAIAFFIKCAYLHDIGKIFIPSEILQKNDKLTDEEYNIIKSHTNRGYDLCISLNELEIYANGVRSHHENENGSGYPDKLEAKEIPLEAKIIKIADIYDALINKRQYKKGFDRIRAIEIIREEVEKGALNRNLFKILLEVVIDDINEEIKDTDVETKKQLKKGLNIVKKIIKKSQE